MRAAGTMFVDINIIAMAVVLAVGAIAYLANKKRLINRLFATLSALAVVWLAARKAAIDGDNALFWIRVTNSLGAFFPLVFFAIKSAVAGNEFYRRLPAVMLINVVGTLLLAIVPFTSWFIPFDSTPASPKWGLGYHAYYLSVGVLLLVLFVSAIFESRRRQGLARMELQLLLLGGLGASALVLFIMILRSAGLGDIAWFSNSVQPVVIIVFYSTVVYAMTSYRILDARQISNIIFRNAAQFATLLVVFGLVFISASVFGSDLLAIALALFVVFISYKNVETACERALGVSSKVSDVRIETLEIVRKEASFDVLEVRFREILRAWSGSDCVLIKGVYEDSSYFNDRELGSSCIEEMKKIKWATPERLSREGSARERDVVREVLEEKKLGVLVLGEGPSFITLFGVGVGPSRRPYTYPQVVELMELAAIMESALERAHFAAKVQRAEQLAALGLVGASLAHEIRNPLVSIKTFVQLLPTHHADPVFREKFSRLVGGEVQRIDDLTQQLLDLAAPRTYQAELLRLHAAVGSGLELVQAKAAERGVRIETDWRADPDAVFTDGGVVKQVLLNLGFNAIQAAEEKGGTDRWIRISTRNVEEGVELAVTDSGPGIAPEFQRRLFQPFQTTKSRGFGLGLAICRDILANVHATITVDPTVPGQGATFRVTYPCQSPSS